MVLIGPRAGVVRLANGQGFARPVHNQYGNNLPADSGAWAPDPNGPGPSPSYPGYAIDGNLGGNDGAWGSDPRQPEIINPVFLPGDDPAGMDSGTANNPGVWRGGIQGFSDKLTVKDRHAYWDIGHQTTGIEGFPPAGSPNTYNDPKTQPPLANLRTVNRTVSYQKGSDATRNQDDLARPYTWVGEQGSGYQPVYGGTPGLYQPYGTRGGIPFPIVDPTQGQGGRELVWSGPPHGLHSLTFPDQADTLLRYQVLPQMRPVRVDRPSNSPQAGQSFSQTVQHQGQEPRGFAAGGRRPSHHQGRGWAGGRK